jgi:hypothetical protein
VDLLDRLAAHLDAGNVARGMRQALVRSQRPMLDDQLRQAMALKELQLDSWMKRRANVLCDIEVQGDRIGLVYCGKVVSLPRRAEDALRYVASTPGAFRPRDISGNLDAAGRIVLTRRLVQEAFLQLEIP